MKMRYPIQMAALATACLMASACVPAARTETGTAGKPAQSIVAPTSGPTVVAPLYNAQQVELGSAGITPGKDGVQLDITVSDLAIGSYGLHLHMVGKCEGPEFKTAGMHWNPDSKMHGRDNPMGAHLGDLPNLVVTKQGEAKLSVALPGVMINDENGLLDADGTSIILHAAPDDYRTDPSGNSGARMICGVFRPLNF
jgi:superoxide dismutase, Cu-Zn family